MTGVSLEEFWFWRSSCYAADEPASQLLSHRL